PLYCTGPDGRILFLDIDPLRFDVVRGPGPPAARVYSLLGQPFRSGLSHRPSTPSYGRVGHIRR
ncbi:hypothetical protein, partial [Streptomyces sp. NPDC003487]